MLVIVSITNLDERHNRLSLDAVVAPESFPIKLAAAELAVPVFGDGHAHVGAWLIFSVERWCSGIRLIFSPFIL